VGSSRIDDARKCFLDLYAYGHEVFRDRALARRSWTLAFFAMAEP
jgi:hypothetical protein